MQKAFVTGCAGFIGSNLVDRLLADGLSVVGWDNFSTGQERFLEGALRHPSFKLIRGDNLDLPALTAAMAGCDTVFHLAANADVRFGTDHPRRNSHAYGLLHAICATAASDGLIVSNPCTITGAMNPPSSRA